MNASRADLVIRRVEGPIARIVMNDPGRANVLSLAMIEALLAALAWADEEAQARVIVLAAQGRVFSAGHDLSELVSDEDRARQSALFHRCSRLMLAIGASKKPVIAEIAGAAVAAGCQLAASCDLAYAATSATFAVSGINLGLFCSTPSVALSRMVGRKQALEMLLTGRFITAAEAQAVGLINRQASAADLPKLVKETALQIAAKDPKAVALGKSLFRRQIEMGVETAYAAAEEAMADNLAFPSAREGISTFLARRGAA